MITCDLNSIFKFKFSFFLREEDKDKFADNVESEIKLF